jgi:hypothetical protein
VHYNCNSLRGINLATPTEIKAPFFSKPRALLEKVSGIEFVEPARWDECCGFGGTFSVFESAVSVRMGRDKVAAHSRAGAEYIVSADSSSSALSHGSLCGVPHGTLGDRRHRGRIDSRRPGCRLSDGRSNRLSAAGASLPANLRHDLPQLHGLTRRHLVDANDDLIVRCPGGVLEKLP